MMSGVAVMAPYGIPPTRVVLEGPAPISRCRQHLPPRSHTDACLRGIFFNYNSQISPAGVTTGQGDWEFWELTPHHTTPPLIITVPRFGVEDFVIPKPYSSW